jgi:hypothetical protein
MAFLSMPRKQPSRRVLAAAEALYAPGPDRRQHDPVRRMTKPIVDADGGIGRPHRVVDTLEAMEAAGTITQAQRDAGERFREDFALGQLDALQCAKLDRVGMGTMMHGPQSGATVGQAAERARVRVWDQIRAVGGIASHGGSCLWYVLGWQQSLRQWATEETMIRNRRTSPEAASGVLRTLLGVLVEKKALDKR